jgi:signal transduction histidine kinase/phage shock protein PspC (stress-responsive transcriptional regulator)
MLVRVGDEVAARPALLRRTDERLLAGVASGVARHLGLPVVVVRVLFALLVTGGVGILAYLALWLLIPSDAPAAEPAADRPARRRSPSGGWSPRAAAGRNRFRQLVGYAALTGAASALLGFAGLSFGGGTIGPVVVAGTGALLIWRQTPRARLERWAAGARRYGVALEGWRRDLLVAGIGLILVVGGVTSFLAAHDALAQARAGALAIGATVVGTLLVAGPALARLARELGAERRARVREADRAEVAAHVHDSVLQTLALLQARSGDPAAVRRLARRQERDLRGWLYGESGSTDRAARTLAGELRAVCGEIEDDHDVDVGVVAVGDLPLDERVRAMVAAAREAVLNAARCSGAGEVSVFIEVEPDRVAVWVRDRGTGFDLDAVPPDRHGVRDSIIGRMARHGGCASVRTAPGAGTEIELVLPRRPP